MYEFELSDKLIKLLSKISKKDSARYKTIWKKINEIISSSDANRYKNLRAPMQAFKRVHIDSHFVLIFRVNENKNAIEFFDLDHHDNIYSVK